MGKRSEDSDSLDLLLDTVCNAFGGIIFIVLLVAILPSGQSAEQEVEARPAAPSQLAELQRKQSALSHDEQIVALQTRTLADLQLPDSKQDLDQIRALEAKMEALKKRVEATQKNTEQIQSDIETAKREKERLRGIADRLKAGLLKGQAERDQGEVRITRLPRLRGVDKANVFIVIFESRVYLTHRPGRTSVLLHDNTDDFKVERLPDQRVFRPLPGRGMPVNDWVNSGQLKQLIDQLPAKLFVVNFCVYPDSAKDLTAVRNTFTELGYDYNWHPLTIDQPLSLVRATGPTAAQ